MPARRLLWAVVSCVGAACAAGPGGGTQPAPQVPTLPPEARLEWRVGAPMLTPRSEVAATTLAGRVYVAGGLLANGKPSDAVEAYSPGLNRWEPMTRLPKPVHHAAMAASGGQLYVIGGFLEDGRATADVWVMAPGGDAWAPAPKLPTPRGAAAAAVVDGRIHVVGGMTSFGPGGQLVAEHAEYNVVDVRWRRLAPLPEARDHLAAAGMGTRLYVVGGRLGSPERNLARAEVYDRATGAWQRLPDMPTPRGGLAAAAWGGRIYVVGGEEPSRTLGAVEVFDPARGSWTQGPPLPTPRHGLAAVGLEAGPLVVAGGGPQPGLSVSATTELLVPVG